MRFSLSTLPFIDREVNLELFMTFVDNEIELIELFAQRPHCDITDQVFCNLIEKVENETALKINSVHLPIYFNRYPNVAARKRISICTSDNNIRINSIREIVRHIEAAGRLNIPIAVLHTGLERNDENEVDSLIESLFVINEVAKKNNVFVALENHTTEAVSVDILISLIQKVDTENLGICLDVGHSNLFSNYSSDLSKSRRYLFSLHIHDNNGEEDEHLFPYEGNIDFDYIIGYLRTTRFQGVVTLELNGENIVLDEDVQMFLKKASNYIKAFNNPRITYSNILEPT